MGNPRTIFFIKDELVLGIIYSVQLRCYTQILPENFRNIISLCLVV